MEYLQYSDEIARIEKALEGFKPYYKWNTFNTITHQNYLYSYFRFKPYYKWNTFNTLISKKHLQMCLSFKPYYKWNTFNTI